MEIKAKRTAFFPHERIELEAVSDTPADVRWSGGGTPASGRGPRFRTRFSQGGTHAIHARSGEGIAEIEISVCPVDEWLARAKDFFGPSLDIGRVKVTASPWVFGRRGSAWTCNTVVRFRRPLRAEDLPSEATLIHELVHVWEHRAGQAQILSGFLEQMRSRFGRDPYDFGGPDGLRDAKALTRFSKEGQAQIVTELWKAQQGYRTDRKEVPFATPGYVEDLRRLVQGAGIGTSDPIRRTFAGVLDSGTATLVNFILAMFE
jgi:hypothetical protein